VQINLASNQRICHHRTLCFSASIAVTLSTFLTSVAFQLKTLGQKAIIWDRYKVSGLFLYMISPECSTSLIHLIDSADTTLEFDIPRRDCRLWHPPFPFYLLVVSTFWCRSRSSFSPNTGLFDPLFCLWRRLSQSLCDIAAIRYLSIYC
jgi:hypothetical protein